jgi:hypothetical protein
MAGAPNGINTAGASVVVASLPAACHVVPVGGGHMVLQLLCSLIAVVHAGSRDKSQG